ncbi:MAG: hypothetical protein ACTS27_11320, partial [Phycisphaerales bacterium]
MAIRLIACAVGVAGVGIVGGCSSPFDTTRDLPRSYARSLPENTESRPRSVFREDEAESEAAVVSLDVDSLPDDYVRYALYHSPAVEAAYQR